MEYDFVVIHRNGVRHQPADAISRLNTKRMDESDTDDDIWVVAVTQTCIFSTKKLVEIAPEKTLNKTKKQKLQQLISFLVHGAPMHIAKRFYSQWKYPGRHSI